MPSEQADTDTAPRYEYEHDAVRRQDDRYAGRVRDLLRAGIHTEAAKWAGKVEHYDRSNDLIDRVYREKRSDGRV